MRYTAEALRAAVELAARYINDRRLPDKAIDVIDEVGASQMLVPESKRRKTIGVKEIEAVVAKIARIPPKSVSKDDRTAAQEPGPRPQDHGVRPGQGDRFFGQRRSSCPARACASPKSRSARYLFSGPTGVGKTEVARQLAHFAWASSLHRFDMSEYMERHSVSAA